MPAAQLLAGLLSRRFDALVGDWDVRHSGECHLERRHRPVPPSRRDIARLWAGTVMSVPGRSHVERSSVPTRFSSLMQEPRQQYHARQHSDQKREH